jgi:ArsR family transcriptional regulator, lead/cadmium/zinc/bismuth-responsive transcriptional repressor
VSSDPVACELLCLDLPKAEAVRAQLATGDELQLAAGAARALGDPTRLRLVAALAATDELCVCDLSWVVGRSDKLVSHHLRALREGGIARARRDGKIVFYELTARGRELLEVLLPAAATARP